MLTTTSLPGRLAIKDLWDASTKAKGKIKMKTVAGEELTFEFKGQQRTIWDSKGNPSRVTIQNVFQSNGVIHVVDTRSASELIGLPRVDRRRKYPHLLRSVRARRGNATGCFFCGMGGSCRMGIAMRALALMAIPIATPVLVER